MTINQVNRHSIRLADDEWGNELMRERAAAFLRSLPRLPHGVANAVEVIEHGGWSLLYTLDTDGELVCVGSANDCAAYDGFAREWREAAYRADWRYVHERAPLAIAC